MRAKDDGQLDTCSCCLHYRASGCGGDLCPCRIEEVFGVHLYRWQRAFLKTINLTHDTNCEGNHQ